MMLSSITEAADTTQTGKPPTEDEVSKSRLLRVPIYPSKVERVFLMPRSQRFSAKYPYLSKQLRPEELKIHVRANLTLHGYDFNRRIFELVEQRSEQQVLQFLNYLELDPKGCLNREGVPLFHRAAGNHCSLIVAGILNKGVSIDMKDRRGKTPLHHAVQSEWAEPISFLIKNGATLDIRDKDGNTPLDIAIQCGNCLAIELLSEAGADLNARPENGEYPLFVALKLKQYCAVNTLIEKGASVTHLDKAGNSFFGLLLRWHFDQAHLALREPLLLDLPDRKGRTPLHLSILAGSFPMLTQLLERQAKLNAKDQNGNTPLHYAARKDMLDCCSLLIVFGAKRDALNHANKTPKMVAELNHTRKAMLLTLTPPTPRRKRKTRSYKRRCRVHHPNSSLGTIQHEDTKARRHKDG